MRDGNEVFSQDNVMPPRHTPLLRAKSYAQPSVFRPEHLLREARWQRGLPDCNVPDICVLDPDGDPVRYGHRSERTRSGAGWACYHTELSGFHMADGTIIGVVENTVGAPFAVLVVEQPFASGCRRGGSVTCAGSDGPAGTIRTTLSVQGRRGGGRTAPIPGWRLRHRADDLEPVQRLGSRAGSLGGPTRAPPRRAVAVRRTRPGTNCGRGIREMAQPFARGHDTLTPAWRHMAGGCHLNRKMDELVGAAGFRLDDLRIGYARGPRPMTFMYEGRARPG